MAPSGDVARRHRRHHAGTVTFQPSPMTTLASVQRIALLSTMLTIRGAPA